MSNVNLKLLQTFILAVEHGSFRKAAEAANRSPSAVSMQIRDLEAQIGIHLFNRSAHLITLTPEGQTLFNQISKAMGEIQASLTQISQSAADRQTKIRIACVPSLAASRLGEILAIFKLRFPRSLVEVVEASPAAALALIQNQEVELFIGPETPDTNNFHFEPIIDDPLVACVPYELHAGESRFQARDLTRYPLILLNAKTAIRSLIDRMVEREGLQLNLRYEVDSAHSALSFVSFGLGVCVLPKIAVPRNETNRFVIVPIDYTPANRVVGVVTARGYVHHGLSKQLIELIRVNLRQLGNEDNVNDL